MSDHGKTETATEKKARLSAGIKTGMVYRVKTGKREFDVQILGKHKEGGWSARNQQTKNKMRVKSINWFVDLEERIARDAAPMPKTRRKGKADPVAEPNKKVLGAAPGAALKAKRKAKIKEDSAKFAKKKSPAKKKAKPETEAKPTAAVGAAEAAITILEKHGPLSAKDITEKARDAGLWAPEGKTDAAVLCYQALRREVNTKGKKSRFVRDGSLFDLASTHKKK